MTARRRSFPALDGDCLPGQSLLRLSSRPGASMRISRRIAALAALGLAAGALAGCSGAGPAMPPGSAGQPAAGGPVVTLRVAVYGSPGYRRAGLFAAYQRLHPGIRIVEHATAQEPGYWQALRQHLATGRGLDDLVAIPLARMSEAVHRYRSSLVPVSTLGGVGGGVNTFEYQWPPWVWRPAYHAGQAYGIGRRPARWRCVTGRNCWPRRACRPARPGWRGTGPLGRATWRPGGSSSSGSRA